MASGSAQQILEDFQQKIHPANLPQIQSYTESHVSLTIAVLSGALSSPFESEYFRV